MKENKIIGEIFREEKREKDCFYNRFLKLAEILKQYINKNKSENQWN